MKQQKRAPRFLTALGANRAGEIFEIEGYAAVGMAGPALVPLTFANTVVMPHGGELMYLPDRRPIVFDLEAGRLETLEENPFSPGEPIFPVAGFNSPGWVLAQVCAYMERTGAVPLPMFAYGAVGWHDLGFRTPLIRVDPEPRQDLKHMAPEAVAAGVRRMRRLLPDNRLRAHLENCAVNFGCPAGKNFFLGRYEAPLPASVSCNASCLGCLSLQQDPALSCSQHRIDFTPTPEEIAEVALTHIRRVPRAVVSFGQGCEGDPLLAARVIEPAIRQIRRATADGTINMNTNGSRPEILDRLFAAGLDSCRISVNSFQEPCYSAYFRPRGYGFSDVLAGLDLALDRKKFVAVNYLNMAGFTDAPEELEALCTFLDRHPVNMIQWRNLNFDPVRYLAVVGGAAALGAPVGMRTVLRRVKKTFPGLRHGYFNPPKESW